MSFLEEHRPAVQVFDCSAAAVYNLLLLFGLTGSVEEDERCSSCAHGLHPSGCRRTGLSSSSYRLLDIANDFRTTTLCCFRNQAGLILITGNSIPFK